MRKKTAVLSISMFVLMLMLSATLVFTTAFAADLVNHNVITNANYGEDIVFNADVVYDSGTSVNSAKVFYNTYGKSTVFKSLDMTNTSGDTYSATLEGNSVVVPYIYYYIQIETDTDTITNGSAENPIRIEVSEKVGYEAPQIMISEAIAISGNRSDFVELKNIGDSVLEMSKVSLIMNEYICDGTDLTIDESNFKGELFLALDNPDRRSKERITSLNEVTINPGETFVVFTAKAADVATEQGGLSSTSSAFNFDYVYSQYTESRVGELGSNIEAIPALENTKAFLAVSEPYSADTAVIPDPSANYTDTAYGTLWTVTYDGQEITKAVVGMNNDGSARLLDKSTRNTFSETNGFGSVQYSPYFVDITYGETTITVQSRLTDTKEVGITVGADKILPALNVVNNTIGIKTAGEAKTLTLSDYITLNDSSYYDNEFDVTYTISKDGGTATDITNGEFDVEGEADYTITATFTSSDFATYADSQIISVVLDDQAPTLSNFDVTSNVSYGDDIEFNVEITDNKEIDTAFLFYKFADNANWIKVDLETGVNSFTLTGIKVPKVYYYLEATDLVGNVGTIGSDETPNTINVAEESGYSTQQLIITEANAITSKRADFLEIYNNSNKPIALSEIEINRYDYIIEDGVFSNGFLTRDANGTSTLSICDSGDDTASRTEITSSNEVYIPSGETFVVFIGAMNPGELGSPPYNLNYIRSYYNETSFPGIDLSNLIDNVNAFVVTKTIDPSPRYDESKYGTAWAVNYREEEQSVAVIGMDNNGAIMLEASSGSNSDSVGSSQFAYYTVDITIGDETETFQAKISDNKQAIISMNSILDEQVPTEMYIAKPEVNLNEESLTLYGKTGIYDLSTLYTIIDNGYTSSEYSITAKEGATLIDDLTQYEYSIGVKTITFTVESTTAVFDSYDVEMIFEVVDSPAIAANDTNDGLLIYGQVNSLDVSDYYTIDDGAFADNYNVSIESNLPLVDDSIQIEGNYIITITITPKNSGDFVDVVKTFSIDVTAKTAPTITEEDTAVSEMIIDANYDLTALFTVDKGSFDNSNISWTVTNNGVAVDVTDNCILAEAGTYIVKLTVNPENESDFTPVESNEITLTLSKVAPEIDTTETVTEDSVSVTITKDSNPIDITSYFNIADNSYADEYTVLYTVTKDGSALELSGNTLPNLAGEYVVTLTLAANDSEFTDIVKSITVNVVKNIPTIVSSDQTVEVKKGTEIDFNEYITINNNDYTASEYTIAYSVVFDGEEQELSGTKFTSNKSGVYEVTVTMTANDSSFEAITETFDITVEQQTSAGLIATLIILGVLLIAGGVVFVIIKKKA